MSERKGDWIQTATGRRFWPLDPRPEDVSIRDIAHALSLICRFVGHALEFYSVAQHSVLVSRLAMTREEALWFLLHDAAEAYIGDISRPLKRSLWADLGPEQMTSIRNVELKLLRCVGEALDLPTLPKKDTTEADDMTVRLHEADCVLLATECRDLMVRGPSWRSLEGIEPLPDKIEPLPPKEAKSLFLARYEELISNG